MSVSLDHVILAARSGAASLAAELCGYIVLGAADQLARTPCQLLASGVELGSEGEVRICLGRATEQVAAEGSLRRLLSQLLEAARSRSPALERASRRPVGPGVVAFIGEIEAALVPVNRGAARRALARLHREAMRAELAVVPDPCDHAASLPSAQNGVRMDVRAADRARVPADQSARRWVIPLTVDAQPSEPVQPASPAPDETEQSSCEQTDPMDTGYGALPRAEHGQLAGESKRREREAQTPKLGSITVCAPSVEHEEPERRSWSGGAIHVEVDDLGDETPLYSRPELGPGALPPPCSSAAELPAAETETASRSEFDEADGGRPVKSPGVLPAVRSPDLPAPASAEGAASACVAPRSRVESLVEVFTAAECRSVPELCRELQQIAGLEGKEAQSSLAPPVTPDEAR
jgi:hypothetical protein